MAKTLQINQVLVTQSFLTLCDPMDCNPPGSSVHEILQARILQWVAIYFSTKESKAESKNEHNVCKVGGGGVRGLVEVHPKQAQNSVHPSPSPFLSPPPHCQPQAKKEG